MLIRLRFTLGAGPNCTGGFKFTLQCPLRATPYSGSVREESAGDHSDGDAQQGTRRNCGHGYGDLFVCSS